MKDGCWLVDRAGFEPAALRSRVGAFPQTGSAWTCQAGDLRPASAAAYQADLPAHETARTEGGLLNWFAHRPLSLSRVSEHAAGPRHDSTVKEESGGEAET